MSTCRSCGALIEWAVTIKGKRIPLDIGIYPDGNLIVDDQGNARTAGPASLLDHDQPLRRSHFASCPNADRHRRRGRDADPERTR